MSVAKISAHLITTRPAVGAGFKPTTTSPVIPAHAGMTECGPANRTKLLATLIYPVLRSFSALLLSQLFAMMN
jgi:hypothetical protein